MHIFKLSFVLSTQIINFEAGQAYRGFYKPIAFWNSKCKEALDPNINFDGILFSNYMATWCTLQLILIWGSINADSKWGKSGTTLTQKQPQNSKNPSPFSALIVALEKCEAHRPACEWFSKSKTWKTVRERCRQRRMLRWLSFWAENRKACKVRSTATQKQLWSNSVTSRLSKVAAFLKLFESYKNTFKVTKSLRCSQSTWRGQTDTYFKDKIIAIQQLCCSCLRNVCLLCCWRCLFLESFPRLSLYDQSTVVQFV